jgi:lysozyme
MPSHELIEQLKRHEGLGRVVGQRTYVYRCTAGARTVGYGHNLDALPLSMNEKVCSEFNGSSVTLKGALWLLDLDASRVCEQVMAQIPWTSKLDQARCDALCNMAFQMGIGGLKKFVFTLGLVRAGQYALAAKAMLQSKWAKQTPDRAKELAEQMRTGTYGRRA